MKAQLIHYAHARSGDKGDTANIGVIARKAEYYPLRSGTSRLSGWRSISPGSALGLWNGSTSRISVR